MTALYVSTDGSDEGTGAADDPLATITAARDAIRALQPLDEPVNVYVSGTHRITAPIAFDEADSGTENYPIRYLDGGIPNLARSICWDSGANVLWVYYPRAWTFGTTKHPIIAAYSVTPE